MLELQVPPSEYYDEANEMFVQVPGVTLVLEHSLISLSKWEAIWHEPFLGVASKKLERTTEQTLSYIECMLVTPKMLPTGLLETLTEEQLKQITDYIEDPHTATTFGGSPGGGAPSRQTVTAEVIYYWMLKSDIPIACEKWHLGRLLTLIRVFEEFDKAAMNKAKRKGKGPARLSSDAASRRAQLNAQRKAQLGTTG